MDKQMIKEKTKYLMY